MKKDVLRQAARYSRTNNRIKLWYRVVAGLAAVVVFITTYALILPALTKERELFCGMEAHTHGAECYYTPDRVLSCEVATHSHEEKCKDDKGNFVCGYANYVIHSHNDTCYDEKGLLSCRLAEIELHTHGESCGECDKLTELHIHGEGCKGENGAIVCGKTELKEHIHTDVCYKTVSGASPVLVCTKKEHTHDEGCYVDKTKDVETAEDWEKSIPKELTGVWSKDVVSVAKSQLGYFESSVNTVTDAEGNVRGYTRYGAWYGSPYGVWDATFVSFCLYYAGVDKNYVPFEADSAKWMKHLEASGYYQKASGYNPKEGDLVFLRDGVGDKAVYTVGVVATVNADNSGAVTGIKTIAGDVGNRVQYQSYDLNDEIIQGYGTLSVAYGEYKNSTPREQSYTDGEVTVKAIYYPAAGIPEGAVLTVKPISEELSDYESCYDKAKTRLDALGGQVKTTAIKDFRLYDIGFVLDGEEIQPLEKVDISVSYPNKEVKAEETVTVFHYVDDKAEVLGVQEYSLENGVLTTDFETESFSLFAIVTSESQVNSIVSLNKHSVSSNTNLRQLGGITFAIVNGNYAMTAKDDGTLGVEEIRVKEDNAITANENLCRWLLTKYSTSSWNYEYYISTTINGTTHYLMLSGGTLQLTTTQASRTRFTFAYSSGNVTVKNGSNYIRVAEIGVSVGSSMQLGLYRVPTGEFTVNFDGQIGLPKYNGSSNHKYRLAENIAVTTTGGGYVTLPATMTLPGNYPMKLNGWYDIINMVYYDSSMLGKQIRVTNNTIFYPEWIAESYDIGQDANVVTNQPDTSDFITTKVFDYNELFNTHSANYSPSNGTWTFDPDSELGFIFFDYFDSPAGNIGDMLNKDVSVGGVTVNQEKTAGKRGASTNFPGTITQNIANEKRLNALFGDDPIAGRIALGEGDWLYSFDPEIGFYYYNSAKNAASYNQSKQRFYVYDYTVNIDSQNSLNDFLPFNYGKTTYKEKDNEANYWFGMKSEITFYLPANSGDPLNIASDGKTDMQLRFSGDDDVWIFIDGELVLDLGGVHDVVYGEVNFATGKVKTGQAIDANNIANNTADSYAGMPGVSGTAGVTETNLPTVLEGGKEHTITIYYLERGSSLSNCSIYFNLSPSYALEITKHDKEGSKLLQGAEFKVYDDEACTKPSNLYLRDEETGTLTEVYDHTFVTGENGVARLWGMLLGKSYYIREVKPPPGYTDMSYYVIRINLSERGEITYVALDSNGGNWVYADAYIFATDEEHRVEIDIYNGKLENLYIGGEKKLYVEKKWAEGSENIPQSVDVRLYANGKATDRTLVLDASTDWKGYFYSLKEKDDEGNDIVYTVKEEDPPYGFSDSYSPTDKAETGTGEIIPAHWEETAQLEAGYVYRLVLPNYYGWAIMGYPDSESIEPAVIDDSKDDQLWYAYEANGGVRLQNVAHPNRYLGIGDNVVGTTTFTGNDTILFLSNGYLKSVYGNYAKKGEKTVIGGSGWGFRTTANENEATGVVAYKWVEEKESTAVEGVEGWIITNTPWEGTMDIPVEKTWDETVTEGHKEAVTVKLYLVETGQTDTVSYIQSLVLSEDNGYKGSFTGLPYPEEGSYYCIMEQTEKFDPTYGGEVVNIFVDNTSHKAARVKIDSQGKAHTVTILNFVLVLLPDTGGGGVALYIASGLILTGVGVSMLYKNKKRRREANYLPHA